MKYYMRRKEQRDIAELQDIAVSLMYKVFRPVPVLHGGTVIWRVYRSPRFSEDIDVYHQNPSAFRGMLERELALLNLSLRKFRETEHSVYAAIGDHRAVRVEFTKRDMTASSVEAEFELVSGGYIMVRALPPEILLREKIQAFIERRKARDLYDIFYLLNFVDLSSVRDDLRGVLEHVREPPSDWRGLRVLILRGLPPSFETVRGRILGAVG